MKLPTFAHKQFTRVEKTCQHPGCGELFLGATHSKFCVFHSSQSNRIRLYKKPDPFKINQALIHLNAGRHELKCALKGCNNKFTIIKQYDAKVYPKFCEIHRNEHQRNMFLQNNILFTKKETV
jgi:hypothetical protein